MEHELSNCPLCGKIGPRLRYKQNDTGIFSCQACDLWYRSPQPSEEELEAIYNNYYTKEKIMGNRPGGSSPENTLEQHLDLIDKFLMPLKGKNVLDFGCGMGVLGSIAKARGANVTGVESSAPAREYLMKAGLSPAYKDADELLVLKDRFDVIILIEVLEHLREPWNDIKKLSGLLSPGGCIYITTINRKGLNIIVNGFHRRELLKMEHLFWFTHSSLDAIRKRAGLNKTVKLRHAVADTKKSPLLRMSQTILSPFDLAGSLKIGMKK